MFIPHGQGFNKTGIFDKNDIAFKSILRKTEQATNTKNLSGAESDEHEK